MFSLPTSSPDPLGLTSSKATLGVPGLPFQRLLCSWSSFSCPFPRVSIPGGTLQHLRRVHSSLLCHSGWHLYLCALWTHLDTPGHLPSEHKHPSCTTNSLETCGTSNSSCTLLFFLPPARTGGFSGCKVMDQHLQAVPN